MTDPTLPCFEAISSLAILPPTLFRRLLDEHATALVASGLDPALIAEQGTEALWSARTALPAALVDAWGGRGTTTTDGAKGHSARGGAARGGRRGSVQGRTVAAGGPPGPTDRVGPRGCRRGARLRTLCGSP